MVAGTEPGGGCVEAARLVGVMGRLVVAATTAACTEECACVGQSTWEGGEVCWVVVRGGAGWGWGDLGVRWGLWEGGSMGRCGDSRGGGA